MRRAAARSGKWAQHFFQMLLVVPAAAEFRATSKLHVAADVSK